jgi:putative ABC transport system permease protein
MDGVTEVGYQSFAGGYHNDPKTFFFIGGASPNIFDLYSEIAVSKSNLDALHAHPNGILITPAMSTHLGGVKVGDHVSLHSTDAVRSDGTRDWDLEVVGFVDRKDSPGAFMFSYGNFDYVNQSRAEPRNLVQQIAVRVRDPEKSIQIARTIDAMFANSGTPTRTSVDRMNWESGVAQIGNVKLMVNGITGAVLFVLLLLTGTSIGQSVEERTAEIGVMKTLGFTDEAVLRFVASEALVQCLLGAIIGLAISAIVSPLMQGRIPGGPPVFFRVPPSVFIFGLLTAIMIALVAAAIPGWRASRLEIVDAVAGR